MKENFSVEQNSNQLESTGVSLKRFFSHKLFYMASLFAALTTPAQSFAQTTQNNRNILQNDGDFKNLRGHFFHTIGRGEGLEENVKSILAPVAVGWGYESDAGQLEIDIPYEYGKDFKRVERTDEGKKRQSDLEDYLGKKLREQLASSFGFFRDGLLERSFRVAYPEESKNLDDISSFKIKRIKITGRASPEALVHGFGSVNPQSEETENKDLATHRAEDKVILEAFRALGVDIGAGVDISYNGIEEQFTNEDISELVNLVESLGLLDKSERTNESTVWDAIGIVCENYNKGKYENDVTKKSLLDRILGSKRGVKIEIVLDGDKSETRTIPLPIGILLLLKGLQMLVRRRRRSPLDEQIEKNSVLVKEQEAIVRKSQEMQGWGLGLQLSKDDRIFSPVFYDARHAFSGEKLNDRNFKREEKNSSGRQGLVRHLLEKEISERMNNIEAIGRGVDYESYVEKVKDKYVESIFKETVHTKIQETFNEIKIDAKKTYQNLTEKSFNSTDLCDVKNKLFVGFLSQKLASVTYSTFRDFVKNIPLDKRLKAKTQTTAMNALGRIMFDQSNIENCINTRISERTRAQQEAMSKYEDWNNLQPKNLEQSREKEIALKNIKIPQFTIADLKNELFEIIKVPFTNMVHYSLGANLEFVSKEKLNTLKQEMMTELLKMWDVHDRSFDEDPSSLAGRGYVVEEEGDKVAPSFKESVKSIGKDAKGKYKILNTAKASRHNRMHPAKDLSELSIHQDPYKKEWAEVMYDEIMFPAVKDSLNTEINLPYSAAMNLRSLAEEVRSSKMK